jgi:hypothetical protein
MSQLIFHFFIVFDYIFEYIRIYGKKFEYEYEYEYDIRIYSVFEYQTNTIIYLCLRLHFNLTTQYNPQYNLITGPFQNWTLSLLLSL